MQTICVDEQNLAKIRAQGGVYVDKTKYIYDLFKTGTYFFIARPRRFGKSLLCSTLAELFANNRPLFNNTWIDQSDWDWQEHPVIQLDMTKAAGAEAKAVDVRDGIVELLLKNALRLGINDLDAGRPALMFEKLINRLYLKTGKGVVVIIDEYDKPLLDVLHHPDRYPAIHDELRAFYGQLKGCSEQLRFVFLTGVFKFAQTSIFSGFNNVQDLTFSDRAGSLLGYTEAEMMTFFSEHLEALAKKKSWGKEQLLFALREKYNGYAFGVDIETKHVSEGVYNPFALNYVFRDQQLLDQWFASGTPTALIKKLEEYGLTALDQENLVVELTHLRVSSEIDNIAALHMLYYAGYLTIKSYADGNVVLDFPNLEVGQALSSLLLPLMTKTPDVALRRATQSLKKVLLAGKLDELQDLMNHILAQLPYGLYGTRKGHEEPDVDGGKKIDYRPQEHYYQTVFHLLFIAAGFVAVAEDMTNRGRIDISVMVNSVVYIFEFKMNESAAAAIQQIKGLGYATKYRTAGRQIYAVGVNFNGKERSVDDFAFEQL